MFVISLQSTNLTLVKTVESTEFECDTKPERYSLDLFTVDLGPVCAK